MEHIVNPIAPVWDEHSRVLILGTMPSPQSRARGFFYGHPQNRFWPTLAAIAREPVPLTTDERRDFALRHGIALWDVLASCDIEGAADSSIQRPVCNDIAGLVARTNITRVFTTGQKATQLYEQHLAQAVGLPAHYLPSPSPANRAVSQQKLEAAYRVVFEG